MKESMADVKDKFDGTLAQILEAMVELKERDTPLSHRHKVLLQELLNFNDEVDKVNGCFSLAYFSSLRKVARGSEGDWDVTFAIEECSSFRDNLNLSISYLFGSSALKRIASRSNEDDEEMAS